MVEKLKCFTKKIFTLFMAFVLVFTGITNYNVIGKGDTMRNVNAKTKEQPTLQLKYDEPATDWESEALPIGNGRMGAMVYGGVEKDIIQVNEESIWSGGPGSDEEYDGGSNDKSAETIHEALQKCREALQNMVSDFSKNSAAYVETESGEIISADYLDLTQDSDFIKNLNLLKGEKNHFGSYQTLGNIVMEDPAYAGAKVISIKSNANTGSNPSERTKSLFDDDPSTKWFTGFGFNREATITWRYNKEIEIHKYTFVSGNDESGRDPKSWTLYGSTDGENFVEIDQQDDVTFEDRKESKEFEVQTPGVFEYYQVVMHKNLDGNNGAFQLTDIIVDGASAKDCPYNSYLRTSDIDHAVQSVHYTLDGATYDREYFMNNPSNVMAIKLTSDKKNGLTRDIYLDSEQTQKEIVVDEANATITLTGQPLDQEEDGLRFAKQIKILAEGGSIEAIDSSTLSVKNADSIVVYMSAATNYQADFGTTYHYFTSEDPLTEVESAIQTAVTKGFDQIRSEHIQDYKSLFDRVKFSINDVPSSDKMTDDLLKDYGESNTADEDRYLEILFYQYGRYLLISSSRENSKLPANLQGIWAQGLSPMWDSDYHTNINLQMNYWLAEQTNLTECHETDIDYINSLVEKGKVTAKKYYCKQDGSDVRGWVIHHENNIWGNTNPSTYTTAFYFPAAAAWMCQDIWEKYAFNEDEEFLASNYDTMLQAALFWVDNLWLDERDNTLVANPSYSPEHGTFSLGCTSDQAIIWELFEEVQKAAKVLGEESSDEVKEIQSAQERLYMPKADRLGGQFGEWKDETTLEIKNYDDHRHQNQLFVLHPGTYVVAGRSSEDDEMIEAAKVTLEKRGDGGTGWSKAWKVNMWARLRDGDRAQKLLAEQLKGSTLTNLFDTHAPFQIDGNFGATSGMTEMLLQSQGDEIEPLAALPSVWANGSIQGIKARGNFELDMEWNDGKLSELSILSGSGKECRLKYSGIGSKKIYDITAKTLITPKEATEDVLTFDTNAGSTYLITDQEIPEITSPDSEDSKVDTPDITETDPKDPKTDTPDISHPDPQDNPNDSENNGNSGNTGNTSDTGNNGITNGSDNSGNAGNDSNLENNDNSDTSLTGMKVGSTFTLHNITYKVISDKKVRVIKVKTKKTSLNIPATVTMKDCRYSVDSIGKKILKKKNKLKKLTIGKNVRSIKAKAFAGCKKIRTILFKTKKLALVGKNAFTGTKGKVKVRMYASCKNKYKKLLKKSGLPKKTNYQTM